MIILNLLSPEKKKELVAEQSFRQIKKSISIIFIASLLSIGLVVATQLLLNRELNSLQTDINQIQISKTGSETTSELIQEINQKIIKISQVQNSYIKWSDVNIVVSKAVPSNVDLKSLKINQTEKTFEIQGIAKTRNDLLEFKSNLDKLSFFEEVVSPISNLIKKENITFELTGVFDSTNFSSDENTQE